MFCLNGFVPVACVVRPPVKFGTAAEVKPPAGAEAVPKLKPVLVVLPIPMELSEGMGGILLAVGCENGLLPVLWGSIDLGRLPTVDALCKNGLPPVEVGMIDTRNGLEPVGVDPSCEANGLPVLTDLTPVLKLDAVEGITTEGDVE